MNFLAHRLDFSLKYIRIKKRYEQISKYIRIKKWYEGISEYIRTKKNNTIEYPNMFASKNWYEYDTNEYSYREIFEYIRISEYSPHPGLEKRKPQRLFKERQKISQICRKEMRKKTFASSTHGLCSQEGVLYSLPD